MKYYAISNDMDLGSDQMTMWKLWRVAQVDEPQPNPSFAELYSEFQLIVCPAHNSAFLVHSHRSHSVIFWHTRQLFSAQKISFASWPETRLQLNTNFAP